MRHVKTTSTDPALVVGLETPDDAAVYRVAPGIAMVQTVDFFTPIVDDPYDWGRIAAANALSDVYAMGGRPLFVLNLVAFPRELLREGILEDILRGGSDVARAAGAPTLGGHSIDDAEPKYGLVAVGEVHPRRMVTNAAARPGDVLVLTKPIGSGVVATAIKSGDADARVVAAAVDVMTTLNRSAAEAMVETGVVAGTDVTGFGLLGHLHRMLLASGVAATLRAEDVPLLPGAVELATAGHVPGGSRRNMADLSGHTTFADSVDDVARLLLSDAQTSGGLLMSVPERRAAALVERLARSEHAAAVIGRVVEGRAGTMGVE